MVEEHAVEQSQQPRLVEHPMSVLGDHPLAKHQMA
jgi:hypothetical protein